MEKAVVETRKLMYWLAICEIRESNKYYIKIEEIPKEIIKLANDSIHKNIVEERVNKK